MYHIATDAVVILDVFKKQTEATPKATIAACKRRLREFQRLSRAKKESGHAQR
jgi:phage-related protein